MAIDLQLLKEMFGKKSEEGGGEDEMFGQNPEEERMNEMATDLRQLKNMLRKMPTEERMLSVPPCRCRVFIVLI